MNKSQIMKLIENLNDEDSVNELLLGTDIEESIRANALTLDNFKAKASDKEFKAYLDSVKDTHVNSVLKTMKENGTWEKQFKDVLESKYPDLFKTEDPIVAQLKEEVAQMKREQAIKDKQIARNQLSKDVKGYLKEQYKDFKYDIPDSIFERCVLDNIDNSKAEVDNFMSFMADVIKSDRETYYNNNNPQPGGTSGAQGGDPPAKMSLSEAMQYANEHPEVDVNTLI